MTFGAFLTGLVLGFLAGGAFGIKTTKEDVANGRAIYVDDVEYRANPAAPQKGRE
jgi:hypothetical protein